MRWLAWLAARSWTGSIRSGTRWRRNGRRSGGWSYRISQLLIPAIDLAQIVAAWQLAIRDPAHMTVFCTDRLALPKSATQTLTPHDCRRRGGITGF